jgi:uncharacterized caspase-like protein
MSRRFLATIAATAGLLLLPFSGGAALAQQQPKRVALIIGNGAYQNVAKLPNPAKDATAIAEMFKKAGFEWVKVRQDVGNLEFKRALREFNDAAQDADVAVVYYAGHGIQVKDMNYMIPVDARLASEYDAEDEAVSLDRIVLAIEPAKRLKLVILDACRDNPFGRTMKRRVAMRAVTGGLAKMEPTFGDTLIAYAAKAGSTAEDGDGVNSPFAAALIKHLSVPGLDIRLAFGRVRDEVLKTTANKQEPFVYGSLGGESVSLVPAPVQAKAAPAPIADVKGDYELVERIASKKGWEAFLASHKDGLYAELARAQLAKLNAADKDAAKPAADNNQGRGTPAADKNEGKITLAAVEPEKPSKPTGPSNEERRVWDRVRDSGDRGKLRDFIAKYPNSPLAEQAQNRLETLDRAQQEREEKARAEREAAQRRDEEAKRQKAEEADRKKAEREATLRREEDAKRQKAEEAERQKAEREAARHREEEARQATQQREEAARQAARQRDEEARQAKSAARPKDEACQHDEERLARLRNSASQGWAREDLRRLQRDTACERVRSEVVALLSSDPGQQPTTPAAPVNTPELIIAAQSELHRLGCFAGDEDGTLGNSTKEALQRYLSQKGRPIKDIKVTDSLVASLKDETKRVCPLTCARGEHPEGDRCIADAKPEKKEEKKATSRERDDEDRPAARAKAKRDEARREREQAKREDARREREQARREDARREREQARREERRREARPKPERRQEPRQASRPQPAARSQAYQPQRSGGGGGGMVGVGF